MSREFREEMLTSYILGEATEDERRAVEREIITNPNVRQELDNLRNFYGKVERELKSEPTLGLTPKQKTVLTRRAHAKSDGGFFARLMRWPVLVPSFAACGIGAIVLWKTAPHMLVPMEINDTSRNSLATTQEMTEEAFIPAPAAAKPQTPREQTNYKTKVETVGRAVMQDTQVLSFGGISRMAAANLSESQSPLIGSNEKGNHDFNTEGYDHISDNPFMSSNDNPLSTFSIDVDTASYSNMRRFINNGQLPPKDAVRIEELINYFPYKYDPPTSRPFATKVEVGPAPWAPRHRLVRIGIKAKDISRTEQAHSNLVFLIDTSGSMNDANKLPLLKQSMKLMVENLNKQDRVAIVVYAGSAGLVLPSTSATEHTTILAALDQLQAGGSTNGGAGIQLAYDTAQQHYIPGGINRVLLATDGDFNVGASSRGDLVRMVEQRAKRGVYLSILGFGMGNYKDASLEQIADKGNGNYAYIDTLREARKVLVEQAGGTLNTVAKDVKIQVEFNPQQVNAYRLIGYENRILAHQDFNDDTKDAGDIGAGHTVTALYEIVPKDVEFNVPGVDPLKYQKSQSTRTKSNSDELLTLKLRYKEPEASRSALIQYAVRDAKRSLDDTTADFRHAASVAAFGMVLRESPHRGEATMDMARDLATGALRGHEDSYRSEFIELIDKAKLLKH